MFNYFLYIIINRNILFNAIVTHMNKYIITVHPLQKRRLLFMPKKYATQRLSKLALPRLLSYKGFLFS